MLELLKERNNNHFMPEIDSDFDWELFLKLALHHRVFPLLSSKIKMLDEELVPSSVKQHLKGRYTQNTFQMLHLSGEMEYVSKLFSENDIHTLFLKGPVLAKELYGHLSLRTSSDLDFLIPIQHLERAEALLAGLGYEKDDYIETILNDWRWRHHHVTYYHPQKRIKLEIHWRLHPGPGREPSFQELWKRKRQTTLTSTPVYLLGKEDLFVFLVAHGARHGWSRIRWLVDIQQMLKQELDWSMVYSFFKTFHNPDVGGQAIILASQLLNTEITRKMRPFITGQRPLKLAQEAIFYLETMVNLHNDPVPKEVSRYHSSHLFSLMTGKQKLYFIISFLHPYPEDAETLPLPKKLHFLYFPLRPMLWVWRKTKMKKPALS
ncbi:hypothetical protein KP78_08460 [Jeotgalibacillus soli]|uniref:Renal dipeptidase n=2 Tax=Jeotgalibacillus soli TaxID=889306 RepID=A0A0C2VZK1_9BACL|nr:nucleotidyltransferase family protein [Jeotgalibacillus soli]KIL49378.1 hypothetical protein KP78_08460 [Jeotgalibacillus soli]